ncbi:MAG TPA: carbamoyltransferase C-terminal domain-containing protein [Planosporangium sp.]|jgi:carbamoyltransferase|nr:carbamoyltransferase C-terminal domain-containing protein [Planosporangium sp.]
MSDAPTVVGINRTQDASIAVITGPSTMYSLQKERISRRKHHWGRRGDLKNLYAPALPRLREPVDLVVECYSSDDEVEHLLAYREELAQTVPFRDGVRVVTVSHHLAHLYSAFYPSPFERAAVMVVDAQGSRVKDFTESFPSADAAPDLLEVASFYTCERGRVECVGKHLWHGDWAEPAGLGCFYYLLTRTIFPSGEGNEGKVMGLAPFGRPHALGLPDLRVDEYRVCIPDEWMDMFAQCARFAFFQDGTGSFDDCADLAAAGQRAFESALLRVAAWLHGETGASDLCFAGGTALNCSANGRLLRESPFDGIFIPPSPHDGGTALGCALYGMIDCLGAPSDFRWSNDFLGPDPDAHAVDEAVRHAPPDLIVDKPADLIDRIAGLLDSGRVVGLHQGRSESGPRALGNRSIIADARHADMREFINSQVKGREWFRPLAPVVLADAATEIFEVDRPAPFMQYAADVRAPYRTVLPAITHVDGTARLQTVEAKNTPFLYALLRAFAARTGCPVLLNTSLNRKGDPLVETPQDSLACLQQTSMHALAMPPYLIRKRVEPPLPGG